MNRKLFLLTGLVAPIILSGTLLCQTGWVANGADLYASPTTTEVGVGTTTPDARLHVQGGTIKVERTTNVNNAVQFYNTSSGTKIWNLIQLPTNHATLPNGFLFEYSSGGFFNILGLSTGGQLTVGSVNPNGYELHVTGDAYLTGTLTTGSDVRWKENISTIENALGKVMSLRGVTYDFRTTEFPENKFPEKRQIGFIAQEIEQILPEVVSTGDDGYKGVAYQNLTPILVEAIKEQQGEIDALRQELRELRASLGHNQKSSGTGSSDMSSVIRLEQNDPNPSDGITRISYYLPENMRGAELVVTEIGSGKEMRRVAIAGNGRGEIAIPVGDLSSGAYLYSIVVDGAMVQSRKMIVK